MQLFPEPRLLRCRYCNHGFPRISIAYHVFYCRSGLMFEFLDQTENDQNDTYKEYVRSLFFSFPFLIVRLAWFLPFLSRKVSTYQHLFHTIKTVALLSGLTRLSTLFPGRPSQHLISLPYQSPPPSTVLLDLFLRSPSIYTPHLSMSQMLVTDTTILASLTRSTPPSLPSRPPSY